MTTVFLGQKNRLAQAIAVLAVTIVGTRIFIASGLTVGIAVSLLLLPLWLPALRRYQWAVPLMLLGLVTILSGAWLTDLHSATHRTSVGSVIDSGLLIIGLLSAVGVILWARELLPLWVIGSMFGTGMLITAVQTGALGGSNAWKFGIGFPVMVIILALLSRPGMRAIDTAALLILAVISVITDSRYRFASLTIAAVLILWQMLPKTSSRRTSALTTIAVFGTIALITYNLVTAVLVEGYLGEQAQARSIDQIDRSGSLIVGGRPELAASISLFADNPLGFGSGTFPTQADILVAKTGMASVGYDPNNGYVENYMFGTGFELHSVAGDMWALFGFPGLAFAIATLVIVIRSLGQTLADRAATGLLVFLCISMLWNTLFSPIYGSLSTIVLTLGLALMPKPPVEPFGSPRSIRTRSARLRARTPA
ncbi:MAG: hypothetical protein ABWX65_09130 [Mycetocola sp.]